MCAIAAGIPDSLKLGIVFNGFFNLTVLAQTVNP